MNSVWFRWFYDYGAIVSAFSLWFLYYVQFKQAKTFNPDLFLKMCYTAMLICFVLLLYFLQK